MSDIDDVLRRASLRRQIVAVAALRDSLRGERADDYEAFADALAPLTDKLLHELMALEGVQPYPHPLAFKWLEEEPA